MQNFPWILDLIETKYRFIVPLFLAHKIEVLRLNEFSAVLLSFLGNQQTNSSIMHMEIKAVAYTPPCFVVFPINFDLFRMTCIKRVFLLADYDIQDLANLTDLLSNYDHSCRGHDLEWVICRIQHYAMTTLCWRSHPDGT